MDLIDAIKKNHIEWVRILLENGANPNCFDDLDEVTPLHYAVTYHASSAVFYLLITAGADIHWRNKATGETPKKLAEGLRYNDIAELLNQFSLYYPSSLSSFAC